MSTNLIAGKDALLKWFQRKSEGYEGVHIQNLHSCFNDGLALCAVLNSLRPEKIEMQEVMEMTPEQRLEKAFSVAESDGVPRLLDVEDLLIAKPDPRSTLLYLSELYHVYSPSAAQAEPTAVPDKSAPAVDAVSTASEVVKRVVQSTEAESKGLRGRNAYEHVVASDQRLGAPSKLPKELLIVVGALEGLLLLCVLINQFIF